MRRVVIDRGAAHCGVDGSLPLPQTQRFDLDQRDADAEHGARRRVRAQRAGARARSGQP